MHPCSTPFSKYISEVLSRKIFGLLAFKIVGSLLTDCEYNKNVYVHCTHVFVLKNGKEHKGMLHTYNVLRHHQ